MCNKDDEKIQLFEKNQAFTKGNLSVDICASRFKSVNDAYDNIVDAFDFLLNSEVGWTVYGWGKIGLVNDVILLGNDIKEPGDNEVLYQEITTHVAHLHPPKGDYLNLYTIHGRSLDNLEFNFSML